MIIPENLKKMNDEKFQAYMENYISRNFSNYNGLKDIKFD